MSDRRITETQFPEDGLVELHQRHIYMCSICHAAWSQVRGTDPQTHRTGCPNAQEGDEVAD